MNTSCTMWQLLLIKHCVSCRFGLLMMSLISELIVFIRMCHQVRLICRLLVNTHMNIKCKHKCLLMRQGFWLVDFFFAMCLFRSSSSLNEQIHKLKKESRLFMMIYLYLVVVSATSWRFYELKVHMQRMTFPATALSLTASLRSSLISHLCAVCHKSAHSLIASAISFVISAETSTGPQECLNQWPVKISSLTSSWPLMSAQGATTRHFTRRWRINERSGAMML